MSIEEGAGAAGRLSVLSPSAAPGSRVRGFWPGLLNGLAARTVGPGGYYNLGNAIGLAGGLSLAACSAGGPATGVAAFLVGNESAVALTAATLVFFWSGEVYHRAWAHSAKPDARLNRQGDFLSAIGALALGLSLALVGLPLLAATAGVMHALGKLGSALHKPGTPIIPGWPRHWPDPYRSVVLLSRLPAALVTMFALMVGLWGPEPIGLMPALLGPGVLLVCNLLWAKADLLLFRPAQ